MTEALVIVAFIATWAETFGLVCLAAACWYVSPIDCDPHYSRPFAVYFTMDAIANVVEMASRFGLVLRGTDDLMMASTSAVVAFVIAHRWFTTRKRVYETETEILSMRNGDDTR